MSKFLASCVFVPTKLHFVSFVGTNTSPHYASYEVQLARGRPLDPEKNTTMALTGQNKIIKIRVSESEEEAIKSKAAQAGMNLSSYLRSVAFAEVRERLSVEQYRVIVGVATNLNQLTRYAHGGTLDKEQIDELIGTLRNILL